jgi:hypothetical protein
MIKYILLFGTILIASSCVKTGECYCTASGVTTVEKGSTEGQGINQQTCENGWYFKEQVAKDSSAACAWVP